MSKWIDKRGPVEASTTYVDGELVGTDMTFTLPEITFATADIQAMGTMSIPLFSMIEDMETTITKVGEDANMGKLQAPKMKTIEHRWVRDVVKSDGSIEKEGCKVFFKCVPKNLQPGNSIELGSASEGDLTYGVFRERLVINGEEVLLVDRLSRKIKINGTDYSSDLDSLL